MKWIPVDSADRISEAVDYSHKERVMIFTFTPKRVIDYTMKTLLQREWNEGKMNMKTYLINCEDYNDISGDVTRQFKLTGETPQVLIIEKGECIFSAVNGKILYGSLKQFAN
jgi:bacillithiol system protein YtxJ